jgi:hypothetical protein
MISSGISRFDNSAIDDATLVDGVTQPANL